MPRSRKSLYAEDYKTFLSLLVEERVRARVTQVELSKKMGTSQSMLSKLEHGVVRMDITDTVDYLTALNVDPASFVKSFMKKVGRASHR